jgi:threonine aldolase
MNSDLIHPRGFGSDNHASIHPEILRGLTDVNTGHAPAYGMDNLTARVRENCKEVFGAGAETYFVFNGTAANVLCLRAFLRSHEAVVAASTAHLTEDECGAPEFHGGHKVLTVASPDGKIAPEGIAKWLTRRGDQHSVQARMVSLTQPTEFGTVYTLEELARLREFTRREGLLLHVDGARLANAAVHLGCGLKDLTSGAGIDALSMGGTKNGMLGGEAVIFFNPDALTHFKYIQKQEMQLPSKTRFIAAQFYAYLRNDLWRRIAEKSCGLARELAAALEDVPEIDIVHPVQSNAVFVRLPKTWVKPLKDACFFYVWDEKQWIARLMLSNDNTSEDIAKFRGAITGLQGAAPRNGGGKSKEN